MPSRDTFLRVTRSGRDESPSGTDPLASGEIGRRATEGAALLVGRGLAVLALGLVANLVLARLLEPRDFGLMALGTVVVVFGGYIAEGGLGAALIRREEPPSRRALEAVNGVQVGGTTLIVVVATAVAVPFGSDGVAVAGMIATLPIVILRAPSLIVLERRLEYRTIALVELVESIAFYAAAVGLVAAGLEIWGVVAAMAIRSIVGTGAMLRYGPLGLIRPRWAWSEARPLIGFGARVQVLAFIGLGREQGTNIAVAAIAGVATLGIWNLAFRVLQAPLMVVTATTRVMFPAITRLLEGDRAPRGPLERGVAVLGVAQAAIVVAVIGFAPALPAVVGDAWDSVPAVLAWAGLGLLVQGPVYVIAAGYLFATGEVGFLIWNTLVRTAVSLAVTLPLLPSLGAEAVGLGWFAGSVVSSLILARRIWVRARAQLLAKLLVPVAAAVAAGGAGWAIASSGSETVAHGLAGAAAAELLLVGTLLVAARPLLREAYGLLNSALRGSPT